MKVAIKVAIAIVGLALASQAKAQDADTRWATQRYCANYDWLGQCARYRYERRRYAQRQQRDPSIRYYAAPRIEEERDNGRRSCRDVRRAVGDQHLTVDGAKKQADEAWAAAVRFHHGEKFLDLANARHLTYTCSRSSIKEGGVTTLGQTLTRCELEAVPCSPVRQREGERNE